MADLSAQQWEVVEELFANAQELAQAEQEAYVNGATTDAAVRAEVR